MHTRFAPSRLLLAAALLALFVLPLPTQASDSPEAAFEGVRKAVKAGDYEAIVDLVAPSERVLMAFSLDMGVDMAVSFWEGDEAKAAQETYAALKKKHKVKSADDGPELAIDSNTSQEEIDAHMMRRAEAMFDGVDLKAYISGLLGFFLKSPMMEGQELFPSVDLTDLQIDGDRASAQAGDAKIDFLREDGRWYLASP